jgi:hypothetical protein
MALSETKRLSWNMIVEPYPGIASRDAQPGM